jgi:sec-independent protein translocase protein TatA
VALLFFGSKAIPDIAKMMGKAMREFQKATNEIKREINDAGEGGLGNGFQDIRNTIQNVKSDIQEGIRKHTGDINSDLQQMKNDVKSGTDNLISDVKTGTDHLTSSINEEVKKEPVASPNDIKKDIDYSI